MASEKLEVTDKYAAQIVYGGSNGVGEQCRRSSHSTLATTTTT